MRVYVSQPMRGYSEEDIEEMRDRVISYAMGKAEDKVLEIPKFNINHMRGTKPVRMLGMSIELMSDADIVLFAPGWQYARGCRIEHRICVDYGIPYEEVSEEDL